MKAFKLGSAGHIENENIFSGSSKACFNHVRFCDDNFCFRSEQVMRRLERGIDSGADALSANNAQEEHKVLYIVEGV